MNLDIVHVTRMASIVSANRYDSDMLLLHFAYGNPVKFNKKIQFYIVLVFLIKFVCT